jgi:hypothetical protein
VVTGALGDASHDIERKLINLAPNRCLSESLIDYTYLRYRILEIIAESAELRISHPHETKSAYRMR